ncbi:class I SAM-dependent methyltransferase, partial [Paracoccaceae bacterium]|nr:class I SAM-dependent methyltransferase [Paracoccaceae bacterium]
MRLDVIELQEFYSDSELGRTTKELINRVLGAKIETDAGSLTIGFGFACPFLENKFKEGENKDFLLLMPSEQGVVSWPKKSKSVSALVDEVSWPVNTSSADLILISHGLEVSDNQDLLLQEVRRVLKDNGKLVILVPNRTGFWARSDSTPFGYGKPYSISQLTSLLRKNQFQIDTITPNLYGFPAKGGYGLKSLFLWEKLGRKLNSFFLGGLLIVEARKDIYAVKKVKSSKVSSYFSSVKVPV